MPMVPIENDREWRVTLYRCAVVDAFARSRFWTPLLDRIEVEGLWPTPEDVEEHWPEGVPDLVAPAALRTAGVPASLETPFRHAPAFDFATACARRVASMPLSTIQGLLSARSGVLLATLAQHRRTLEDAFVLRLSSHPAGSEALCQLAARPELSQRQAHIVRDWALARILAGRSHAPSDPVDERAPTWGEAFAAQTTLGFRSADLARITVSRPRYALAVLAGRGITLDASQQVQLIDAAETVMRRTRKPGGYLPALRELVGALLDQPFADPDLLDCLAPAAANDLHLAERFVAHPNASLSACTQVFDAVPEPLIARRIAERTDVAESPRLIRSLLEANDSNVLATLCSRFEGDTLAEAFSRLMLVDPERTAVVLEERATTLRAVVQPADLLPLLTRQGREVRERTLQQLGRLRPEG